MNFESDNWRKRYVNTLTAYIFVVWVFIIGSLAGNSPAGSIAKILFAPFLLDITRGVGAEGAVYFRVITSVTLLLMVFFVILRIRSTKKSSEALLSVAGVVVTTIHYGLVALGVISTGLH